MSKETTYGYVKSLGYPSILGYVNSGPNGVIDEKRLNNILNHMSKNGWKEIIVTKDNLMSLKGSTQMRYIINDDDGLKFRTGGFFLKFFDADDDSELTDSYILYLSHKPGVNSIVQYSNIYKMYIKEKYKKIKVEKVGRKKQPKKEKVQKSAKVPKVPKVPKSKKVQYKRPVDVTDFPITLKDSSGKDVVVYYARDSYNMERFMDSVKYKKALEHGWEFSD